MCGIAGLINHYISNDVALGLVEKFQDSLKHRGPDDVGAFIQTPIVSAMTRLSIIDLDKGKQPFISPKKKAVIYQNGEIYNYRELRIELQNKGCVFQTNSDTEVISIGYDEWGIEVLLQKLDGMFAIAIIDMAQKILFLARDKFGEKPLFYTKCENKFAYSSSIQTFKNINWVSFELSSQSLLQYLCLHYILGENTIFKNIHRVLPGCYISIPFNVDRINKFRYYRLNLNREVAEDTFTLQNLLTKSVKSRMISDVPVGIFLSGGLDSSLITAIAASNSKQVHTFSMGFPNSTYDESTYSKLVAQHFSTDHYHFEFDERSFACLLEDVSKCLDEPIGDQALLPVYWLARECKNRVKVVLSGEGGDEVFAGYDYYRNLLMHRYNKDLLNSIISASIPVTPSGFPLVCNMQTALSLILYTEDYKKSEWEEDLINWLDSSKNDLQRATAADLTTWLPDDLLVKFDRMTMANSIEGRAPFLSPEIIEYGTNLPVKQRINTSEKELLKQLGLKLLPKDVCVRRKHGFVLPMQSWIEQWFADKSIKEYIKSVDFPIINQNKLGLILSVDILNGVSDPRFMFSLLMLLEWYRNFRSN